MKAFDKKNISKLPGSPGVYFFLGNRGKILYIGKAINIKKRVKSHFGHNYRWDKPRKAAELPRGTNFIDQVSKIKYLKTVSDIDALLLESQLIKKHKPKYNILLRDDKQYFYVGFSPQSGFATAGQARDKLPILHITHQPTLRIRYIGPFTDGKSLKLVLRYLRKVFPYYTQKHRRLPCSYCHIDLCPGPNPNIAEYKKNITKIKGILRGQKPRVFSTLKKEMARASKNLEYEKAAKIRGQIAALENIFAHRPKGESSLLLSGGFEGPFGMVPRRGQKGLSLGAPRWRGENDARKQVAKTLLLYNIKSIEAYDISNIQGKEPVASMVRFDNGKPNKSMYRKFRIRLPEKPNDVAMIREVVRRRLAHPEWPYPDLILIDGGRGQLSAALSELKKVKIYNLKFKNKIPKVAALAKRFNELYVPGRKNPIPLNKLPKETKHLLMYARDEAHRFAITYHRKLHRKKTTRG